MKFGQLVTYNVRNNFFLRNHAQNEERIVVPDLFSFFKKALFKVKPSDQHLNFNIFR